MDICIELEQPAASGGGGGSRMEALFTFVARDVLDGTPQPVNPLRPEAKADQELFCRRQRVADGRKAARALAKAKGHQCEPAAPHAPPCPCEPPLAPLLLHPLSELVIAPPPSISISRQIVCRLLLSVECMPVPFRRVVRAGVLG